MQLQENTLFANRYTLQKLLGCGGFSEVWLAKDNWTHLLIALKVYAPGQGMDTNGLQEFCGELASVYDLNHQNLLKPQHVDTWENMPYLIMAYCSQGSCSSRLGRMSEIEMWKFIRDVASGLSYLHAKEVVHQDIKPDNTLIDDSGNYLITDFGVSTRARSTLRKSVVSSTAGGTTAYMGPERFSRQPAPTKASDIWSFGAMCFELIEGYVPFGEIGGGMQKGGAEIHSIQAHVSDAIKYVITKMLQKETWDRPTAVSVLEWTNSPSDIKIDYSLLEDADPALSSGTASSAGRKTTLTDSHATQHFGTQSQTSEKETITVSMSPVKLKVPAKGGDFVVEVDTNATRWSCYVGQLPLWVHLTKNQGNKLYFHFDKNDSGKNRECEPRVVVSSGGSSKSANFSIVQKHKSTLKWIIGIAIVVVSVFCAISIANYQEEVRNISNYHYNVIKSFDNNLNNADIDNIESLQKALSNLKSIQSLENDPKFKGDIVYRQKRNLLKAKAESLQLIANRKYQNAPAGTTVERKNLEKLNKINSIIEQI